MCDGIANEDVPCRVQRVLFTIYVVFFVEKHGKMLPLQHDIYLMLYVQSWTPDDGRKDRTKHVE